MTAAESSPAGIDPQESLLEQGDPVVDGFPNRAQGLDACARTRPACSSARRPRRPSRPRPTGCPPGRRAPATARRRSTRITSTTTYSGPRSRWGGAPEVRRRARRRACARCSGQRSVDALHVPVELAVVQPLGCGGHAARSDGDCAALRQGLVRTRRPCGPTQATASALGIDRRGDRRDLVERDRVERRDRAVRVDVLAEDDRLAGRVARDRVRVLERQHAAARGVRAGALDLLLGRAVASCSSATISRMRRVGLDALATTPGPTPSCRIGDVGERVVDRVDRVAEPALLADLVEQARAHRAAQQRRVDRQRRALARVGRTSIVRRGSIIRRCDWLVSRSSTSGVGSSAGAGSYGSGSGSVGKRPNSSPERAVRGHVLEVADDERAAARARPAALAEGDDRRRG